MLLSQILLKSILRLENKIYVCINGVDTTKFYVNPSKTMNDKKFIIGCVANFWELKDQDDFIKGNRYFKK